MPAAVGVSFFTERSKLALFAVKFKLHGMSPTIQCRRNYTAFFKRGVKKFKIRGRSEIYIGRIFFRKNKISHRTADYVERAAERKSDFFKLTKKLPIIVCGRDHIAAIRGVYSRSSGGFVSVSYYFFAARRDFSFFIRHTLPFLIYPCKSNRLFRLIAGRLPGAFAEKRLALIVFLQKTRYFCSLFCNFSGNFYYYNI